MVYEARLRYVFPQGATRALLEFGYTSLGKKNGCCRFMGRDRDDRWELPGVFPERPLYTRAEMKEMIESLGIDYEEFEGAYVRAYNGDPPIVRM